MRNPKNLIAVFSTVVLFTVSMPVVSFAAAGWQKECGEGEDETWVCLDEDGGMIANRLLHMDDNIYYVNEDGAMAVNQWVSFLNGPGNEEPCDEPVTTVWYYFGPTGKAYAGKRKKLVKTSTFLTMRAICFQAGRHTEMNQTCTI